MELEVKLVWLEGLSEKSGGLPIEVGMAWRFVPKIGVNIGVTKIGVKIARKIWANEQMSKSGP